MNSPKTLEQIVEGNWILNLNEKNVLELARVSTIWQLISISKEDEEWLEWVDTNKVLNEDTIVVAKFIVWKIDSVLWELPESIKEKKISTVVNKISRKMITSWDFESNYIWNYIWRIAGDIKDINKRYSDRIKNSLTRNLESENETLKEESTTDSLTWLLNRKAMDLFIKEAIEDNKRNWRNYGIILIDIDNFKGINDNFWHWMWDIVLKEISKIFKSMFRWYDKVSRWWWEEFLILMKDWNIIDYNKKLNIVREKVSLLLKKLANNHEDADKSNPLSWEVTISIWATMIKEGDDITSSTNRADNALYKAKHWWKNGLVSICWNNITEDIKWIKQ